MGNTPKRKERILSVIARLMDIASIPAAAMHSLVGVCTFAEAQTCGRTGSMISKAVRSATRLNGMSGHRRLVAALSDLSDYSACVRPLRIRISGIVPPAVILTDAAAEDSGASLGAVLVDPVHNRYEYFGTRIAESLVHKCRPCGKSQIMCQAGLVTVPTHYNARLS